MMERLEKREFTAKYCASKLELKQSGNAVERIGKTLFNSKIKLTPHQIQAALFAFKSPLRKGVILADEVGLGKTIEAGIVIAQTWFEKKGKILIIAPAALLRQWQDELEEKFGLISVILDRRLYNTKKNQGYSNPIKAVEERILICSYQMCSQLKDDIKAAGFEIVVIDEAHKLRNVHNEKSVTANNVKYAIEHYKKVLLTATPIQNNLLDLYGLSTIIDEDIFGDKGVFKYNYIRNFDENEEELELRLKSILHRTLRKQVQQYVQFTNRIPKTFSFELTEEEKQVYERIRSLLNNSDEDSYLIPSSQRHLLVLILCKLMGSSMQAIAFTLNKMKARLIALKEGAEYQIEDIFEFEDFLPEEFDEIEEKEDREIDIEKINEEIKNLEEIIYMAEGVQNESKYFALLEALDYSFKNLKKMGAEEKVLIFTESRKTQDYLYRALLNDGYTDILLYNGTNTSEESKVIYQEWIERESNAEKINSSKAVNMRAAILDRFKERGKILIATEAGAEGLNLQFCSTVINYDLPWNPQRVEQRIGRCHRFGQKHDVVVINFISSNNVIEQRIYELLSTKFNLFTEILGSSDSVLGTIEDGKDIEKAIVEIYSKCRTIKEINRAFDELQESYKDDISASMKRTKEELLENFEEDVQQYFLDIMSSTEASITKIERLLWNLLKAMWENKVAFVDEEFSFVYGDKHYRVATQNKTGEYIDFNLTSKLGKVLLEETATLGRKTGHIIFNMSEYPFKISRITKLIGEKGYLILKKVSIESFENEEYLVFNGILEDKSRLDSDLCEMLFRVPTEEFDGELVQNELLALLIEDSRINVQSILTESQMRNDEYLKTEIAKINQWADDRIQSVELSVETMRQQRKELQHQSDMASNLAEKERLEKEILQISSKIKKSWLQLANAEEDVEQERKGMINAIKKENMKQSFEEEVFTVSFEVR